MKMLSVLLLLCVVHWATTRFTSKMEDKRHLIEVVDMARTSNRTLNQTLLQTFVVDVSNMTGTVTHCKMLFCKARGILTPLLGGEHKLVRVLKMYTQHKHVEGKCLQVKETGNQMRLRKLLEHLKRCAQRVLSKAKDQP